MTRRQVMVAIASIAAGSTLGLAQQDKKGDAELATVTLIIDGMT